MMEKKSTLSIALSQEELFVVMAYLKIPLMLGLNNQVLASLPEANRDMVLGVAERALIARGYLEIKKGLLELIPVVQAIIGACSAPQKTLAIKCNSSKQLPEDYYFHVSRKMNVMHMFPMTAIHQFTMVKDQVALLRAAFATMKLVEPQNLQPMSGTLAKNLVVQAQDTAKEGGVAKVKTILKSDTNLEPDFIEAFSKSLTMPHKNILTMFIQHPEDNQGQADGFTLLVSEAYTWMLKSVDDGNIYISTTTPKLVHEALNHLYVV